MAISEEGGFRLKKEDITVDISGDPDICGNAWDPKIIDKLENQLKGKKAQAIVFERITLMTHHLL